MKEQLTLSQQKKFSPNVKVIQDKITGKNYKPGIVFELAVAIPNKSNNGKYALIVEHDWLAHANVNSMYTLATEGKAPFTVCIGLAAGSLPMKDGTIRYMRANCYDLFDNEYANFIVYEVIPYVENKYSIKFFESADMHMASGGSSGALSAFCLGWFHPEYFHRLYLSSPSFLAMGRGNEVPYLIRKFETKPFKIFLDVCENEPNDYFGYSKAIDEQAIESFIFAGYNIKTAYYKDTWHCGKYGDELEAYKRNAWLWEEYNKPIKPLKNSKLHQ